MIKRALKWIGQKIWKYNLLAVLFCYLTVHFVAGFYNQKQEATICKAQLSAVSTLFTPRPMACPKVEPQKCPLQVQPIQPVVPQPKAEVAPRQAEPLDHNDVLIKAVEAAERAKRRVLQVTD